MLTYCHLLTTLSILEIIARWGPLPISIILRSEGSRIGDAESGADIKIGEQYYCVKHQQVRGGLKGLNKFDSYYSDKLILKLSDRIFVSNKNIYAFEKNFCVKQKHLCI